MDLMSSEVANREVTAKLAAKHQEMQDDAPFCWLDMLLSAGHYSAAWPTDSDETTISTSHVHVM